LLKNSLNQRTGPSTDEAEARAIGYVKSTILAGLQDKDQIIRQTVGAVITSILGSEEPGSWPEALDAITKGMGSQDFNVVEVSLASKTCC
jgi:transportin-1